MTPLELTQDGAAVGKKATPVYVNPEAIAWWRGDPEQQGHWQTRIHFTDGYDMFVKEPPGLVASLVARAHNMAVLSAP
jgi:hypothetical protein